MLVVSFALGGSYAVHPPVVRLLRGLPAQPAQQARVLELVDLDAQRPAALDHLLLAVGAEAPEGEVAAGAGAQGHEEVLLGEELEGVAGLGGAGAHEVAALGVEAGDLEDVEDVVDVVFRQAPGGDGADEVGVAVEVVGGGGGEEVVDVGVAAGAEEVVAAAAVGVGAVPGEGVADDGGHGAEVGEVGPQPVVGGEVGGVELAGARGPEALAGVVEVPDV